MLQRNGPFEVPSNSGWNISQRLFWKYAEVYPIRNKSEVVTKFEEFYKEISRRLKS
jgi:hypothetical protein